MSKLRKPIHTIAALAAILALCSSHQPAVVSAFSPAPLVVHSRASKRIGIARPPHHFGSPDPSTSTAMMLFDKDLFNDFDFFGKGENQNSSLPRGIAILFVALYVAFQCFTVVEAGEIGIASTLGNLNRFDPGFHWRNPLLTSVTRLSTKTELLEQSNFVPTKEGLTVELDTAVLVKLDSQRAIELYRSVGPDFMRKLVSPEASSSVRGLTSESEAKALYTAGRSELQNRMKSELTEKLEPKGILVEEVLLKNVVLPKDLSDSIQEKARAEQESARMEFVLLKETQEAKRKAIEAEGIADFQRIVSKGITPSLLQWKGIEATEKLAKSNNSKIVIMGNSKNSLPVILGSDNNSK